MSYNQSNAVSPIIIALDYANGAGALKMADKLDPSVCRVKVGMELFTSAGPSIIEALHKKGFDIFLDLKFHDIPVTVAKACKAAADLGVWMVNVHASGGRRMLEAARESVHSVKNPPKLIAVTVLTSMDAVDLRGTGVNRDPREQVLHLAELAKNSGLDGVVCSAQESAHLRERIEQPFCLVTPGIRPKDSELGDQRRVVTPGQAVKMGVDYMVIGRPVTQAADPIVVLNQILSEVAVEK